MATQSISQDLTDLLVTKNFDPKYTDKDGRDSDPNEAVTYSFDYVSGSGKNYGTLVIVLGDGNDMMVFFGDNLGRSMENPEDKSEWFKFLEQLSNFATQHRYTFSPKDLNKLKHTMAGIAAIKEGLFEGYYGTRRVSYMGEQTEARLVIKHNRMLGENDKRYRYVESLFIETADGERFKLPFTKLAGGRAMLEHVRQGGKPYDIRGNHICEMVTEMNLLARFNRASQSRVFEGSTAALVESAQTYYHSLQESLKRMSAGRGYREYFESWSPADIGSEDALVEDIKTLFVEQTLDARIESALPLLAKIQQGTAMKEVQVFENWIANMAEGTWALPDTPEQEAKLQELMSAELIAGPDGTNATEQLYDIVGDDHLFDLIQAAAAADPNSNIWDNAEIVGRIGELGVDVSAITERGAEQTPEPVAEGHQLDEGAIETITSLVKKIPGIGKYYQMAQEYKPQLIQILKTSKSGKEVKQKMEQLVAQSTVPVSEAGILKQLGGLAAGGGSILTAMWMNAMGLIDGVLARAAAGEVGGAVAAGSYLGLIPVMMMLMAVMLLFKGSKEHSDEKAQAFQAQRKGLSESRMADVDIIVQGIINGEIDPYDVMAHPKNKEEEYVSKMLEKEYEDVASEHRLHPDDDFEEILDRVVERFAENYKHQMDEADSPYFAETTVAGGMAPVQGELEEAQWGQAKQDPMNYNAAITGSYYEDEDPLARLKSLALPK